MLRVCSTARTTEKCPWKTTEKCPWKTTEKCPWKITEKSVVTDVILTSYQEYLAFISDISKCIVSSNSYISH